MAYYTFRAHNGMTLGYARQVRAAAHHLVKKAAEGVGWNGAGTKPSGLSESYPGMSYSPSFRMEEIPGAQQKWEGHAKYNIFRLDLQAINNGFANWSVQTNDSGETVAVCLMKVGPTFSQTQLAHGLIMSAERQMLCEMTD